MRTNVMSQSYTQTEPYMMYWVVQRVYTSPNNEICHMATDKWLVHRYRVQLGLEDSNFHMSMTNSFKRCKYKEYVYVTLESGNSLCRRLPLCQYVTMPTTSHTGQGYRRLIVTLNLTLSVMYLKQKGRINFDSMRSKSTRRSSPRVGHFC